MLGLEPQFQFLLSTVFQDLGLLVGSDGPARGPAEAGHESHLWGEVAALVTIIEYFAYPIIMDCCQNFFAWTTENKSFWCRPGLIGRNSPIVRNGDNQ